MKRKDRETSVDFAYEISDSCEWVVISMIDEQNMPYCVPISIARHENTIYFHGAKFGQRVKSLKANNAICISCVSYTHRIPAMFTTEFESAIIRGKAYEISDNDEKTFAMKLLCLRHASTHMEGFEAAIENSLRRTSVWKVEVEEITGKRKRFDADGKEIKFED